MTLTVALEQEDDGRWIAEVMDIPGVLAYGQSREEAFTKAQVLALHALADKLSRTWFRNGSAWLPGNSKAVCSLRWRRTWVEFPSNQTDLKLNHGVLRAW